MLQKLFLLFTVGLILLTGCAKTPDLPEGTADHTHQPAEAPQTVADPVSGYCGNTQTTVVINNEFGQPTEESYTFMGGPSVNLTDLLINLEYDPGKTCKCADYDITVTTEFGGPYYVSFSEAYARRKNEEGYLVQADLTEEQLQAVRTIIEDL